MIAFKTFKVKKWYGYLENVIFSTFHGSRSHCQNFMIKKFIFFRSVIRVFPRPFTHGGEQVQGDKALMRGGLMRGDIYLMGGT